MTLCGHLTPPSIIQKVSIHGDIMKSIIVIILSILCVCTYSAQSSQTSKKQSAAKKMGSFKPPVKGELIKFKLKRSATIQGKFHRIKKKKIYVEIQEGVIVGYRLSSISSDDIWKFIKDEYDARVKKELASFSASIATQKRLAAQVDKNIDNQAFSRFNFGDSQALTHYKVKRTKGIRYRKMALETVSSKFIYCQTTLAKKNCELTFKFDDNNKLCAVTLYFEPRQIQEDESDITSEVQEDWQIMRDIILKKYKKPSETSEFPDLNTIDKAYVTFSKTDSWNLKNKSIKVGVLCNLLEYKPGIQIIDTSVAKPEEEEELEEPEDDADKF